MNSFGRKFRVSIFGESHGILIGVVLDGVRAGIPLSEDDLKADLDRRRSGAYGTTPRKEQDQPRIVSGVFNGHTTGAPLTIVFENGDTRSHDYSNLVTQPRPGHADFVAREKWHGMSDYRGGGHFSGRITLGLVAAGVVAKKMIPQVKITSEILEIGGQKDYQAILNDAIERGDSLGGIIECRAEGLPIGWGEPFFDSVEARLSHAIFSVPATRGIEFGTGFAAARMFGSQHNDLIVDADGRTATNHAGGVNGGISNGNPLVFRVAVKPTSSISLPQPSYNFARSAVEELVVHGRHDACIALRIPIVIEAVTAITLADLAAVSE